MPRPMRIKIFTGSSASTVEGQVNAWLDQLGSASIIKTETALSGAAEKANDGTHPFIVVTIWYELQNSN